MIGTWTRLCWRARTRCCGAEGLEVIFGFGELDELVLAYATTIHISQGSEHPAVVTRA
jgi:ATP-dependent exoDNAse (exonuclease V) alpha subunit